MGRRRLLLVLALALGAAVSAAPAPAAAVDGGASIATCTLYANSGAAPGGDGDIDRPFGSVRQLVDALGPGQTGCLGQGAVFNENIDLAGKRGNPDAPIRLASQDPAQPATIEAVPGSQIHPAINFGPDTAYIHVVGLRIHGRQAAAGAPAIYLNGTGNALIGNDITHTGVTTCVYTGQFAGRRATDILIDGNAIHSCGGAPGDTASAGISASYTNGLRITNNYVYENPRHGILLYPDADGTQVLNNVVDSQGNGKSEGKGIQLAGDSGSATDNVEIARNIVTSNETYQIGHSWPGPVGGGNVVHDNCLFSSGGQADFEPPPSGYTIGGGNIQGQHPQYVNRSAPPSGFALTETSPCKGKGPLPAVTTGIMQLSVDPEAKEVIRAHFVEGTVDNRFQAGTWGVEIGADEATLVPVGRSLDLQQVGGPQLVLSNDPLFPPGGFQASTTYAYRVTAANSSARVPGPVEHLTTPAAPRIAPPPFTMSYDHVGKRRGRVLSKIKVTRPPRGARARVSCSGGSCPFKTERPIRDVRRLQGRVLRPGTVITVSMVYSAFERFNGRAVRLRVTGGRKLVRREGCTSMFEQGIRTCLGVTRRITLHPKRPRFRFFRVNHVPLDATVTVRCSGRGCPKLPRCRIADGGPAEAVSLLGRSKVTRTGTRFEVRVLKPGTRGFITRIALKRHNRSQSRAVQTSGFLSPNTRIPSSCDSA